MKSENYLFLDLLYITDSIFLIIFLNVHIDVSISQKKKKKKKKKSMSLDLNNVQEWLKNQLRSLPRDRKIMF